MSQVSAPYMINNKNMKSWYTEISVARSYFTLVDCTWEQNGEIQSWETLVIGLVDGPRGGGSHRH